jgi:predicted lipid-binding transport protein (Tim44 family)
MWYRAGCHGEILRQLRDGRHLIPGPRRRLGGSAGAVSLVVADAAFGRAGGGAHAGVAHVASSHSGGHVFYGGGGSGGSIITLLILAVVAWYLYRRFFAAPAGNLGAAGPGPGSPIADGVAGAVLGALTGGRANESAGPPPMAPTRPGLPAALDVIRARDPAFEIETFLQRAEMTFFLVKRGMQNNDAVAVRPYLGDDLFARLSHTLADSAARHRHVLMESLNVRAVHLVDAGSSDVDQRLTIHFDLVYRTKVFDDARRLLEDEGEDARHGEVWTFARSAAARTPEGGGVIAAKCPVCGAELRLSLDGTCTHCRSSVTNGQVDWVVTDVRQAAFVGFGADPLLGIAAPTATAGIASLIGSDPAFRWETFAARVDTGFRALQAAWCQQNLEAGRAFLSPGAYFAWRAQLETLAAEGRRNVMDDLNVRAIQPVRVIHGRVYDDLTVRISAEAADYEVDSTGKIVFGDRSPRPFTEEWTFQRSVGVATSAKAGLLENTCPNCGAPLALTQIGECRYCKAAVTSGRFDWVVSRIEQEEDIARADGSARDLGTEVATMVGGALVGSVLGSLFSNDDR